VASHIDSKVLSLSQENEFHTFPTLAQGLDASLSRVDARQPDLFGLLLRHTRWESHFLTGKNTGMGESKDQSRCWRFSISRSQGIMPALSPVMSGSFFSIVLEIMSGDEETRRRKWISPTMDTEKHVLTNFWSTTIALCEIWLPRHASFNSTYFHEVGLPCLTRQRGIS
jgi:hypothetical protein